MTYFSQKNICHKLYIIFLNIHFLNFITECCLKPDDQTPRECCNSMSCKCDGSFTLTQNTHQPVVYSICLVDLTGQIIFEDSEFCPEGNAHVKVSFKSKNRTILMNMEYQYFTTFTGWSSVISSSAWPSFIFFFTNLLTSVFTLIFQMLDKLLSIQKELLEYAQRFLPMKTLTRNEKKLMMRKQDFKCSHCQMDFERNDISVVGKI